MQELKAQPRNQLGKSVKTLRASGFLPAVVYGESIPNQPVTLAYKEFMDVLDRAGESSLITLNIDGKPHTVLIHDVAHDPLTNLPIHADLYAVRMDKKIEIRVPVLFIGDSPAVKNDGGVLVKVAQELEISALPHDLPHELYADLSSLIILGSTLHVKDIVVPQGVTILADDQETIAVVESPRSEEEFAALSAVVGETAPAEVKTEQELKAENKKLAEATEPLS